MATALYTSYDVATSLALFCVVLDCGLLPGATLNSSMLECLIRAEIV